MEPWATIGLLLAVPAVVYGVLIMIFTRGWYRKTEVHEQTGGNPGYKVSVVIAARNEERNILSILGDLSRQSYPAGLTEVIVADDGSADSTAMLAEDFIANNNGFTIRLVKVGGADGTGSKKRAISLGIGEASGSIILVTDADCRVGRNWISEMVRYFEDENIAMVSGPVALTGRPGCLNRFQSMEFLGLVASGAGAVKAGLPFICNGANLAYRKDVFHEVKGFEGNEGYLSGDDVFLMHKIKKLKGSQSICFAQQKEAIVRTQPAPGMAAFLRQRARWASKSPAYRDAFSRWVAWIVFTFNLALLSAFIAGFFYPCFFSVAAGMIVFKMLADLPLMRGITRFTGRKQRMRGYVILQMIYPVYVIAAAIFSLFRRKSW